MVGYYLATQGRTTALDLRAKGAGFNSDQPIQELQDQVFASSNGYSQILLLRVLSRMC